MGIINRERALYMATGIDNTGLYSGRREAMGIIKAMASQITSFDVFSGIGLSAATAFASAAKDSYNFEKEFRKNMLEVATISTQIGGSMTDFMNRVVSITQQIPISAPEAAKALYQIVSAGHDGADGMKVLEVSARSAVGGLTDTITASDAITSILNAYKLSANQAENISDQLFTTVRLGKTDFGQLGRSIAQVAPIAAAYGVEIDQVLAAVATLTKQGTPTAQAMTQIRAAIVGVSKYLGDGAYNSRTFQEALEMVRQKAGGSEAKLREFIPEIEAVNGLLGLTGQNAREAASHLNEMGNSTGATEAAFKKMKDEVGNQIVLLTNNITAALRPMGTALLEEVSDVAQKFNEAFADGSAQEAIKHLGDLIVIVTGALVGYKGSIVAVTAAKTLYKAVTDWIIKAKVAEASRIVLTGKAYAAEAAIMAKNTGAHVLLTNALKAQAAAALKNAAAMLTNPYVLAAAAITTLGYALYSYVTRATSAEIAQRKFNDAVGELNKKEEERRQKIQQLLNIIRDETETDYAKIKAYEELKRLSPMLTAAYDLEKLKVLELKEANEQLNKERDKTNYDSIIANINKYSEYVKRMNKGGEVMSNVGTLYPNIVEEYGVNTTWKERREYAKESLKQWENALKEYNERVTEAEKAEWEANTPVEEKVKHYEKLKESLEAERRALYQQVEPSTILKSSVEGMNEAWGQMPNLVDRIKLDILNKQLDETTGKIKSLTGKGDSSMLIVTKNKAHWEEQKKSAVSALEAIDSRVQSMLKVGDKAGAKSFLVGDLKKTEKEADAIVKSYSDSLSKLNEANKSLKVYDFSDKTKNDALKSQQELSRSILDQDLKLQEMRLAIMEDGRKKRLRQSELEYKQQKAAIDKEYQDTVQKYRDQHKPVPNSVRTVYEARLGANNAAKVARDNRIEDDYLKERREHEAALTAYLLTEEDKRKKAIRERYDAEREWAKKQFEGENMTEEEYKAYSAKIDTAEAEDSLNELLEKYQSYTDKRLRIEQDFEKQRKELEKSGASQETLDEVNYQREEALKAVDEEFASRQEEYQGWCNQIANLSLEQLLSLLEQAKTELDKMENSGVSDNKLATQRAKVNKLQEQIRSEKTSTTPEKRSIEQWQKLHKTLSDVKGEFEDIGASVGGVAGEFLSAAGDIAGSAISMIDGIVTLSNSSAMAMQGTAAAAATSISMVEKASVILAVISAALQIATKIASLIKGKSKSELDAERMEAVTNRIADSEKIINSYIEKRIDLIKQATREEQKYLAATTKQAIANQRTYYENLFKSLRGNDLLSKEGKNNNLTAEQLGIRSIEDLKKFFDSERLQSFLRKGYDLRDFDKWKEIADADDALAKKEKDLAENTAKNLTGITLDDARNALDEFLKDADASMEDVAGSFENYMQDAMLGIVKQNTLNKALEDWYNHFEQAMDSNGGLDDTEVKNLQQEYENAFTTAQEAYNNMLKVANISPESDSSGRQASEKGIASMSQDSANELNGNFSALLIYSNKTAEGVTSLRESMNYILEIQRAGWSDVRVIRELTGRIQANTDRIFELSETIERNTGLTAKAVESINTKGIYLKK